MKKIILFLLALFFITVNFAQEQDRDIALNKQFKLSYTFLGLGANYEFPLNKKIALEVGLV